MDIFTTGCDDYRSALKCIENCGAGSHWFMLPEEKPLKTVIKGIPVGVEEGTVKEELERKGYKISSVVRMKRDALIRTTGWQ